jgi:DtxR family Mn-dependent transcriptional regulator
MGNDKRREHALEAILMAEEKGDTSFEGLKRVHPEEVTRADIDDLVEQELVRSEDGALHLTPSGRNRAEDVMRRHRLVEVMLTTLLGLDRERASEIGCMAEHDLRPEMVESVCTLLGHPSTCPHGRPIPPGRCCRDRRTTVATQVLPMSALAAGDRGRVIYITPKHHERMHRLTSLGLTPGTIVEVHQRRPVYCIRFEETELAIDHDVAEDIHVSRVPNGRGEAVHPTRRGGRRRRWGRR